MQDKTLERLKVWQEKVLPLERALKGINAARGILEGKPRIYITDNNGHEINICHADIGLDRTTQAMIAKVIHSALMIRDQEVRGELEKSLGPEEEVPADE